MRRCLPRRAVEPRRVQYDPMQLSLWDEAELARCAAHIVEDLRCAVEMPVAYYDALWLAQVRGGLPVVCRSIPTGETHEGVIRINPAVGRGGMTSILLHELVHRMADGSRWECLNPVVTDLPRRVFLELLAVRVTGGMVH